MLLLASFSMASCDSVIDAIFGEVDNPVFLNDHNEITFNNCMFKKVAIESPNVYSYLIGVDLKDLPDIPITIKRIFRYSGMG